MPSGGDQGVWERASDKAAVYSRRTRGGPCVAGWTHGKKWSGSISKGELQDFLMDWVWSVSERGSWPNEAMRRVKLTLTQMGSGCGKQGSGGGGSNSPALDRTSSR